jgi:hypothetical protein
LLYLKFSKIKEIDLWQVSHWVIKSYKARSLTWENLEVRAAEIQERSYSGQEVWILFAASVAGGLQSWVLGFTRDNCAQGIG